MEQLLDKVLVRQRMSAYGAIAQDVVEFAHSTINNQQQRLLNNNYVELTLDDIRAIYQKCL